MVDANSSKLDRGLLGPAGLALEESDYVRAVAEVARWSRDKQFAEDWLSARARRSLAHDASALFVYEMLDQVDLVWLPGLLPLSFPRHDVGSLRYFALKWERQLTASSKRLGIVPSRSLSRSLDLAKAFAVLCHPAVGLDSAFWAEPASTEVSWRWPMRIAVLEQNSSSELHAFQQEWPANRLTDCTPLSREHPRVEVLIIRGGPRDALLKLSASNVRVHATVLLLESPMDGQWSDWEPSLAAIQALTGAAGVVIVGPQPGIFAWLLRWVIELSHNVSMDIAFMRVLGRERFLQKLDPRLPAAASLGREATKLAQRIRDLEPTARIDLAAWTSTALKLGVSQAESFDAVYEVTHEQFAEELKHAADSGQIRFDHEHQGASALTEWSELEREARREGADEETARYLRGVVRSDVDEPVHDVLVQGKTYSLALNIAPLTEDEAPQGVPFPDDQIDWPESEIVTLQVLFAEPRQWNEPLHGTLELPRRGASSVHTFTFTPRIEGTFSARVTLHHRGRVLQTALLNANVVSSETAVTGGSTLLKLEVEAEVVRSFGTLDDRADFDAFLVCNHASDNRPAVTAVSGTGGAYVASLDDSTATLQSISDLLTELAYGRSTPTAKKKALSSRATSDLMCNLAREGNVLFRSLVQDYIDRSTAAARIRDAEYLQIVTMKHDAIVPLEFVYAYLPPKDGAKVCPNAKKALRAGKCPDTCTPKSSPADHVCPMGFWGLQKVIERHVHEPTLDKAAKIVTQPVRGRNRLNVRGPLLLATSQQVPKKERATLLAKIRKLDEKSTDATAWKIWKEKIQQSRPRLLVMLPHTAGNGSSITLEIGGDTLRSIHIDKTYVQVSGDPPPIALLFGCDIAQAGKSNAYLNHAAVFRQANAALVLATTATVAATDAAKVTGRLTELLVERAGKVPTCFGEVLRAAKREAVADDLLVALCLVAFGDADWILN